MAKTANQNLIYNFEKKIGKQAAAMVERHLHAIMRQYLHIHNDRPDSVLKSTKVKPAMGEYKLLGLNLQGSKTAFILNFGFTGVREATTVYFSAPRYKVGKTQRKRHPWHLPAFDIFTGIYQDSGALDFLVAELTRTRTENLQIAIDGMVLRFNSRNNGPEQ